MTSPQSEIRVSFSNTVQNVPYAAESEEDVHPYVSIVEDPPAVDRIPELANEPELKKFILEMNPKNGTFETFRICLWQDTSENKIIRNISLGFHFQDRNLFSRYSACMDLVGHILQILADTPTPQEYLPILDIQSAFLKVEGVRGFVFDLFLKGIGSDNNEATKRLVEELNRLRPVLCGQSPQ